MMEFKGAIGSVEEKKNSSKRCEHHAQDLEKREIIGGEMELDVRPTCAFKTPQFKIAPISEI